MRTWAVDTWRSLVAMTNPQTGLPADNIPESLAPGDRSGYTSPTNIGGYLWSTIAARELGIISRGEATARLIRTLKTLYRMEHHVPSGMYYNWYDEETGKALTSWPGSGDKVYAFASSVDNGWLGAALLVVANSDRAAGPWARRIFDRMRWKAFYNDNSDPAHQVRAGGLVHGGFYPYEDGRPGGTYLGTHIGGEPVWLTTHHYDTTVSETRITTYLGIITGQINPTAYYATWRTFPDTCDWSWQEMKPVGVTRRYYGLDVYEGAYTYRGLHIVPGWGGSMFEELMPDVFVDEATWAPSSWGRNHPLHVRAQREHGLVDADYGYWGFSPSSNPAGGYREYGVDPLGLGPGNEPGNGANGYFSDQEMTNYDVGFDGCRAATNPTPTYGDGVVTPHASFLAMMHEPDRGVHEPREHPGRLRRVRPRWVLRRRRGPVRHGRPALPLARPGHGHGRDRQRARQRRHPSRLQHPGRGARAQARHRHRGVRRQPDRLTRSRTSLIDERSDPCAPSSAPPRTASPTATSTATAGWTPTRTHGWPSRRGSRTSSCACPSRRRSA